MTKEDLIILYLSLSLAFVQWKWLQAEKRVSYLEGQASIYALQAGDDGVTPIYTKADKKGKAHDDI